MAGAFSAHPAAANGSPSGTPLAMVVAVGLFIASNIPITLTVLTTSKIVASPGGFSAEAVSLGQSLLCAGWASCSLLVVPWSDTVGRKPVLFSLVTGGLFSAACSMAASSELLYAVSMFGVGALPAASILAYVLCQELVPSAQWTRTLVIMKVANFTMVIIMAMVSKWVSASWTWRQETAAWYTLYVLFLVCGPSAMADAPVTRSAAEVPSAVPSTGAAAPAKSSMLLAGRHGDGGRSPRGSLGETSLLRAVGHGDGRLHGVMGRELRSRTLATCCCWSAGIVANYTLSYSAGKLSLDVCANVALLASASTIAVMVAAPIVAFLGARRAQMILLAAASLVFGVLSLLPPDSTWVLNGALLGQFFLTMILFTLYSLLMVTFPARCRGTAAGLANTTSRFAGMAAPVIALRPAPVALAAIGLLTMLAGVATWTLPESLHEPPGTRGSGAAQAAEKDRV